MPVSGRVREDDADLVDFVGDYCVALVRKRFRVYQDGSVYTSTSGITVVRGKLMRRWDPDAGDQEGKPASFATQEEAVAYIKRWLL